MLEKVEELSSLASPQIAGSLIKNRQFELKPRNLSIFSLSWGGGGVPAVMTSLWKFTSEI